MPNFYCMFWLNIYEMKVRKLYVSGFMHTSYAKKVKGLSKEKPKQTKEQKTPQTRTTAW